MNDVFSLFLTELGVKHTTYSNVFYKLHPYRDTLYGISAALEKYNIPNISVKIEADDLKKIEVPFVAYLEKDFIIIKEILPNDIKYIWNGRKFIMSFQEFVRVWSGILLIAEPNINSKEPNYKKHLVYSFILLIKRISFIVLMLLTISISIKMPSQMGVIILMLLNLLGVYIGSLLFSKQIKMDSKIADRICSFLKQLDCNNVLNSDASNIATFSWSEIGLSYFVGNLIIILYFPDYLLFTVLLNFFSLPYTVWSIWYQYKKVRQWCTLCLIVQILLWAIFAVNVLMKNVYLGSTINYMFGYFAAIYIVILLIINKLSDWMTKKQDYYNLMYRYNSIKMKEEIFKLLLYKQPKFEIGKFVSQIIWGDANSSIRITVLTNPHCNPCAQMHFRLQKVMHEIEAKACIQYIFSAFTANLQDSNRVLIAAYLQKERSVANAIFDNWFRWGKYNPLKFSQIFELHLDDLNVVEESDKHEKWALENSLKETPTFFLNGYLLPPEYDVEDLVYLINNLVLSDDGMIQDDGNHRNRSVVKSN